MPSTMYKKAKILKPKKIPKHISQIDPISGKPGPLGWGPHTKGPQPEAIRLHFKNRAIQEVHHYQNTDGLICSTKAFGRIFQNIVYEMGLEDPDYDPRIGSTKRFRIGKATLQLIQDVAEQFIVKEFEEAVLAQVHAERFTLMQRDMKFVKDRRLLREGYRVCPNERSKESLRHTLRMLYGEKLNKKGKYTAEMEEKRSREQRRKHRAHTKKLKKAFAVRRRR